MQRIDHSVAYNFLHPVPASLDKGWFILMPPSTAYDGPKIQVLASRGMLGRLHLRARRWR